MKNRIFSICKLILLSSILFACSRDATSPEKEIRQYINTVKLAAEERDHSALNDMIHESYRDQKGMNREQLVKMLRAYFFTHQNIHLFIKIENIQLLNNDSTNKNKAYVSLYIAMAGTTITDLNTLGRLRAKIYQFDFELLKENEWTLQRAKWKPASVKNLL